MAQTEINSMFTNAGVPATGLTPTVRIWEIDGILQTLIVGAPDGTGQNTDGNMIEIKGNGSPGTGDGFYTFLFDIGVGYDQTKKYLIRADGGAILPDTDRYQIADIEPNVFDEPMADHIIPDTTGETLNQNNQLLIDVENVRLITSLILKYETGRTKIDKVAMTLTVYDTNCVDILRVFSLLDSSGNPSIDEVCERKPISATDGVPVCP